MIRIKELTWDERAEEHIARHGVTYDEVAEAVENIKYTRPSGEYRLVLGQTAAGRYITVILDDEGDGFWYLVTAREMSASERRLIRRKG